MPAISPPATSPRLTRRYAGTRLGRQELEAELLDDAEGALWSLKRLDESRVKAAPDLARVVVAIDPAVSTGPDSAETGIVVAGLGADGIGYVLADLSGKLRPEEWAGRAITAFRAHAADRIIGEANNGGDLVEATLRAVDAGVPFRAVSASRGKRVRAEPVAALYEQGRVRHVANPPASGRVGSFTLILRNDATAGRTTTWPAAVDWPAATAPVRDTAANAVNIFSFVTYDAGTTWFGVLAGRGMA
jgi:phage terminase large subunit-like protein